MLVMYDYLAGLSACNTVSKFGYTALLLATVSQAEEQGGSGSVCHHKILLVPGQANATGT